VGAASRAADVSAMNVASHAGPPRRASAAEISASKARYADLSDDDAIELAKHRSADLLRAKLVPELRLEPGQRVKAFLGADRAIVDNPGSAPSALVESIGAPLSALDAGRRRPLDGDLVAVGDHFEPRNAPVEAKLPADPQAEIELPGTGVGIGIDAVPDATAHVLSDKVVIPNSRRDTTTVLIAAMLGAEVVYLVNSENAPERYSLALDLPDGATLEPGRAGEAVVRSGGKTLVTVDAPTAFDAQGTRVPVRYEISGATLDVVAEHRGNGYLYPLTIDPYFQNDAYSWGAGEASTNMWSNAIQSPANGPFLMPFFQGSGGGLSVIAPSGRDYAASAFGEWYGTTFPDTFIEQVDFLDVDHDPGSPGACTYEGIFSNGTWATGGAYDANRNVLYTGWPYYPICGYTTHQTSSFFVGNSQWPDEKSLGDPEASDTSSYAIFMLMTAGGRRSSNAGNLMRGANVWRYDWYAPTIAALPGSPPSSSSPDWVDDSNPFDAAKRATFQLADRGLGLRALEIRRANQDLSPGPVLTVKDFGCLASHTSPCNASMTYGSEPLPEGLTKVSATAIDFGDRRSAPVTWNAKVDRTAPTITSVSGTLKDEAADLSSNNVYSLTVSAIDGSTASGAQSRAGVTKLELLRNGQPISFVDDEREETVTLSATQPCTPGSCAMTASFDVPASELPLGSSSLTARATDALGHTSTSPLAIVVRDDQVEPDLDLTTSSPSPTGELLVGFDARDGAPYDDAAGRPYGSGAVQVEIFLDGDYKGGASRACSKGGCTLKDSVAVNGRGGLSEHEVVGIAYDDAGNSRVTQVGRKRSAFPSYGFNALLNGSAPGDIDEDFDRVTGGGGNVLRMTLPWCGLLDHQPLATPPDKWKWGGTGPDDPMATGYDGVVREAKERGLKLVFSVIDAPKWDSGSKPEENVKCVQDPLFEGDKSAKPSANPPDPQLRSYWESFVGAVLARYGPIHDDPRTPETTQLGIANSPLMAIEAWNEPNLPTFWGSLKDPKKWYGEQPERFADIVSWTYEELKGRGLDDDVKLTAGGLSPSGRYPDNDTVSAAGYARAAFAHIDPAVVDAISLHLYASTAESTRQANNRVQRQYEAVSDTLDNVSQRFEGKKRWITEIGFPSSRFKPDAVAKHTSEATQRQRLLESFERFALGKKVDMFLIHTLYDPIDGEGGEANNFGLWRATPTLVSLSTPQCDDKSDNDGDYGWDWNGVPGHYRDLQCKGPFDNWESDLRPPYKNKKVYCELAYLAAVGTGRPPNHASCPSP